MRITVLSLCLCLCLSSVVQGQTTNTLSKVQFADANTVFASGMSGTVLRSLDGGITWDLLPTGVTQHLIGVSFPTPSAGTVVGGDALWGGNTIIRTGNSGATWEQQSSGTAWVLAGVSFPLVDVGYAVGDRGTALKTTNGGTNWTPLPTGVEEYLYGVTFTDVNTGTVVGGAGRILRTTNGGSSWFSQSSGTTAGLYGVSFATAEIGTTVGNIGKILRTTNGGTTWTSQTSGTTFPLRAVHMVNANIICAVGWYGIILRSTNGGTSWSGQQYPGFQDLYGVAFRDAMTGVIVGQGGLILRTTDGGASWDIPLPVQLGSFTGRHVGSSHVLLEWMTLSELNNFGFEVQRSPDPSRPFATLPQSFVPGHGTTLVPQYYAFTDSHALSGRQYYRLKQIDLDGTVHYSDAIVVDVTTGVKTGPGVSAFALRQNFPNPFNPSTEIEFTVPAGGHVKLAVYDALGNEIALLVNQEKGEGRYAVAWNAAGMASGVYYYRLTAGSFSEVRKMLLLR